MKQTILLTILAVVFGMTQFANSIFFSIGKWEKIFCFIMGIISVLCGISIALNIGNR